MIENTALYALHEWRQAATAPLTMFASFSKHAYSNPASPFAHTQAGRSVAAGFELVERLTRQYAKPGFGIHETTVDGKKAKVKDVIVLKEKFCNLRHFKRSIKGEKEPKILVVAPMSGHHATLLRGTVEALLPHAEVYITDWIDAKEVPFYEGKFDLDDYIEYVIDFIRFLGKNVHVIAVCQPAVPVFAATAIMGENEDPYAPKSITLIGGPIDTRKNPTKVNEHAREKSLDWFESSVITRVPFNYPGFMRRVYPGFMQLTGFMTMNLDRHIGEYVKLFNHLVQGDGESAEAHRKFYNEYLSVSDITAEFYMQTIDKVFKRHCLPKGTFDWRGRMVDPGAIEKTAVLCIEGEKDDISGVGQTKAAISLCTGLPASKKHYHLQKGVGHYGLFNGRNYREQIVPVILKHMKTNA